MRRRRTATFASLVLVAGLVAGAANPAAAAPASAPSALDTVVPKPVSVQADPNGAYSLHPGTVVFAQLGSADADQAARLLAEKLRPSTGYPLPVVPVPAGMPAPGISFQLTRDADQIGAEGYRLTTSRQGVRIEATGRAGLENGAQTLRQLLPSKVESKAKQAGPWTVPGGRIVDRPRYGHRGMMLDVARNFVPQNEVKELIDQLSYYKMNTLHLHLTDDQGWRLQIDSWPRLATYGGSTKINGGPGGYYTKAQYRDLVDYAAKRNITIIPEVDLPGHTTAALASYAELNCDGVAPPLYTGPDTGFSSLCIGAKPTAKFVDDVIREVAALTPGQYLHIGGDEANNTSAPDYAAFMKLVEQTVAKYGKKMLGWNESLQATTPTASTGQYWYPWTDDEETLQKAKEGAKLVMSPANRSYLDMRYADATPPLASLWAGDVEAKNAYDWDPDKGIDNVPAGTVLGVEATLFTTFTPTKESREFMMYPRLPELAEVGWTPEAGRSWDSIASRLPAQAERWKQWNVTFYPSPQVNWGK
ncbi:beta-N-acetylhexosaminidase [Amycolatopsis minnesotensis]|uniref:beta-N-acetylhexosaminidase n=1 Tax=Amycolatopsis minnesotensis TaxID=337894 RepID=UPI0031D3F992